MPALGWNIPGHTLSAAIAYHVLQQKSPTLLLVNRPDAYAELHRVNSNTPNSD
jgi:hypothetical protein